MFTCSFKHKCSGCSGTVTAGAMSLEVIAREKMPLFWFVFNLRVGGFVQLTVAGQMGDGMSRVVWCHNIYIMRQSKKKKEKKKPCTPLML